MTGVLARAAKVLKLPIVATTTARDRMWGPTSPELVEALPGARTDMVTAGAGEGSEGERKVLGRMYAWFRGWRPRARLRRGGTYKHES